MNALARIILLLCLGTLSLLSGTGCAGLLNAAATRNVHEVYVGARREAVVRRLGPPLQTSSYDPPVDLSAFPNPPTYAGQGKVALCDDYRLNGLLVTQSNNATLARDEGYPLALFITGGLAELIYFPATVADLGARSVRRYHLRFYYDRAGILLGESRRLAPLPPPPPSRN